MCALLNISVQAALSVNGRARGVLSDATLLSRDTEELGANISESEQRVAELEGVALSDAEVISMTTKTAQTAINDTRTLKEEIQLFLVSAGTRDPISYYLMTVTVLRLCWRACRGNWIQQSCCQVTGCQKWVQW